MDVIDSRNKIHEIAMQIMYGFLITEENGGTINFEETVSEMSGKKYENCDVFLKEVLIKGLKYQNETISFISKYLKNWKFDRLNTCIQAILIMAVTGYKYCGEEEKAIAINIAVKLAKKYGEENDYKFVNAILDNCLDDIK